jgi:hypothetical protein
MAKKHNSITSPVFQNRSSMALLKYFFLMALDFKYKFNNFAPKNIMRNIFLFSIFVLLTSNLAIAQSKQKRKLAGRLDRNFEVECLGAGSQGTQLLKVYFYFKKDKEAGIYAKQNAVIAVMFKGVFSGASGCIFALCEYQWRWANDRPCQGR